MKFKKCAWCDYSTPGYTALMKHQVAKHPKERKAAEEEFSEMTTMLYRYLGVKKSEAV